MASSVNPNTQPTLGTVLIQIQNMADDLKEIKTTVEATQKTLRGTNGDSGLVGRVEALEGKLAVIMWVGGIVLGSLLTIVIYHIVAP